jgi:hypothetical protein
MALYVSCKNCNGRGSLQCNNCICKKCDSKGKISCSACSNGYISCRTCAATGQVSSKILFFTVHDTCPQCGGSKKIACKSCDRSTFIVCSSCKGAGRNSQCSKCNGTQKITCSECDGKGTFASEWLKSLPSLPVDRLRFEYEKRQREVSTINIDASRLSREINELYEWYEQDKRAHPANYDHAGSSLGWDGLQNQINEGQRRCSELEREMSAIDEVLNQKWK